jgi:hypothetical protein
MVGGLNKNTMNKVAKLWYTESGELRLLKEWENAPPEKISAYAEMASYNGWKKRIERIKSESLAVVNVDEVMMGYVFKDELKRDSFHDLPGATWTQTVNGYEHEVALIHLPKADNSTDSDIGSLNYPGRDIVRKAIDNIGTGQSNASGMVAGIGDPDEHGNVIWVTEPVRSPGCDPDNPKPDLIDTIKDLEEQIDAANARIAEIAKLKEQLAAKVDNKTAINISAAAGKHRHELPVTYRPSVRDVCETSFSIGATWAHSELNAKLESANKRIADMDNALRTCNEIITKLIS